MTKLEKKRDLLIKKYYEENFLHHNDIQIGFDMATAEWKRIVEPLVKALEIEMGNSGTRQAEEALEKYYEEIN